MKQKHNLEHFFKKTNSQNRNTAKINENNPISQQNLTNNSNISQHSNTSENQNIQIAVQSEITDDIFSDSDSNSDSDHYSSSDSENSPISLSDHQSHTPLLDVIDSSEIGNDTDIENHISHSQGASISTTSKRKKYLSEKDIPLAEKNLYIKVCKLLNHTQNHEIKNYDMHCREVHKQEKNVSRWKLQCTLCGKDFRKVDYFLLHRGDKCPIYKVDNLLRFASLQLDEFLSPEELLLEHIAIVAASCNISSRQIASPEFKAFISFLLKTSPVQSIPLNYSDKDVTRTIVKIYDKAKTSTIESLKISQLPVFLLIDGGQNAFIHSYQVLACRRKFILCI